MYDGVMISVRIRGGAAKDCPITIGLYQESTLSLYLSTIAFYVLIVHIKSMPQYMLLESQENK